jgi:hypothetical protein
MFDLWVPPKPAIIRPVDKELRRNLLRPIERELRTTLRGKPVLATSFLPGFFPGALAEFVPPPTVAYQTATTSGTNGSLFTHTFVSFGTANAQRYIVVAIHHGSPVDVGINSVTIGGIAATVLGPFNGGTGSLWYGVAFAYALVPTGTFGTIAVTYSTNIFNNGIGVWSLTAPRDAGPTVDVDATASVSTTSSPLELLIQDGCAAFVASTSQGLNTAHAGAFAERYEVNLGGEGVIGSSSDLSNYNSTSPVSGTCTYTGGPASAAAIGMVWR